MKELEPVENIPKMEWPDNIVVYGHHLKQRIENARPDLRLVSLEGTDWFNEDEPDFDDVDSIRGAPDFVTYEIKQKRFLWAMLRSALIEIYCKKGDTGVVAVQDKSLRTVVEREVKDLNQRSGLSLEVKYRI